MSDLIERQAAIRKLKRMATQAYIDKLNGSAETIINCCIDVIERQIPSAQPERKTGWWLIREGISDAQCSECKMYFRDVYDMDNSDAFCRHCGAKMEGLKVVEDE